MSTHGTLVRALAMAEKEVVHILRDRQFLIFALGMPVVLILTFGYAVSFDIERIPLVVVDQDRTQNSRRLVTRFTASDTFRIVATRDDPDAVEPLFRSYSAKAALIIPHGFARRIASGDEARVQRLLDGADNTTASIALGYATAVSLSASRAELLRRLGEVPIPVAIRIRTFFNPGLKSAIFLVPGLMVVILVMIAVMLTALTIAREYERGSMEQLFATPIGRLEVILGKLGPYFLIGLVQVLLVLTMGVTLFGVPVRGSLLLLFAVSSVFLLAMLMQGLLISVLTRNQMVASMAALTSTFLPALLLSGFVFPVENMPATLRFLAAILPPQYYVRALRSILLRGNGLAVVLPDLLILGLFFVVLLILSTFRFKRSLG
ncbi:MAG: ABC transporter permease [Deltaproteobacteria bacterium]|nr:ABC transporter permease [Deltaproteobacteria bacterium]